MRGGRPVRFALVNPAWSFEGSIYFGCREPHLPLEYGYARALLEAAGHEATVIDAQARGLADGALRDEVAALRADAIVVTTAPSYLFWRCAPPELRVPQQALRALHGLPGLRLAVGPHASTTPRATLRKLGVDAVVMGECEDVLVELADRPRSRWGEIDSIAWLEGDEARVQGGPRASDMGRLPALRWDEATVARHAHHHHRFDAAPIGPGAEVEASRGCPYHCTFCAKDNFREGYRKRPLDVLLDELDGLVAQGVRYVYFIDEIFLPDRPLLEALVDRPVSFGVQMRVDNWSREMLDLLGRAGCVSIEAGVESITREGRSLLAKRCKLSTEQLGDLLIHAKQSVPFVQANLIQSPTDDPADVAAFRERLRQHGVWANEPVPMFPYPGSPEYTMRWGAPDDQAWERSVAHYLDRFDRFSDLQDSRPLPLSALEIAPPGHG
ncbi:TIGR04295 family B12-binding domain-containing radical SAM protein [Sorangium sp. wiwo2]|uniref:TIGR04295 family B12-binding domain-containing radical SAM protein n=1 Tax=Sorangium atrum TaxID=2995308 RepID=A0ABT5BXK7_9BACT|nr:TIGR04295 family B12-binding domain-containing radical SAM protein [Sorangium aterium]MDC0678894.1 TIGR04295 family B12-binding domain-containing radical SAM protein [Sorangium aterium]